MQITASNYRRPVKKKLRPHRWNCFKFSENARRGLSSSARRKELYARGLPIVPDFPLYLPGNN